jgi:hypothetical protein
MVSRIKCGFDRLDEEMTKGCARRWELLGRIAGMALGFGVLVADLPVIRHNLMGIPLSRGDRVVLWIGLIPACLGLLGLIASGMAHHLSPAARAGADAQPKLTATRRYKRLAMMVLVLGVAMIVCVTVR